MKRPMRRSLLIGIPILVCIIIIAATASWFVWPGIFKSITAGTTTTAATRIVQAGSSADLPLTQYVNPFIGTTAPAQNLYSRATDAGNVIPDATYPLGMVQWGPDTPANTPGAYAYRDHMIKGFSLTHFSGRGCPVWGDFPFMPAVGAPAVASAFSHSNEVASPGYYQVHLEGPNVEVALTATAHAGFGQFTYPSSSSSSLFINAAGSVKGNSNAVLNFNSATQELTGQTTSKIGCGNNPYTLYFAAHFDRTFTQVRGSGSSAVTLALNTLTNKVLHATVGISFVSIANARLNRDTEIGNATFMAIRQAADAGWNRRLNSIQVQGGTSDEKTNFYTALYHTFFHPNVFNDVNSQYLGFDKKVHILTKGQRAQYENITTWDGYRTLAPLWSIIAPTEASDLAQSLVNDAQQGDGHLPRWEQANADSHGMNGDGADVEVADIYAYGNTQFDTVAALSAMMHGQAKVRDGFADYVSLGYVAAKTTGNSVVITQEYTNDDFALAQFAKALGDNTDYTTYLQRSNNWQNVLNPASGYVQPRNSNGSWALDFKATSGQGFQENDAAQSTWMENFDLHSLFAKLGGNARVVQRLDTFFTQLNDGGNSPYSFIGNEPGFEIPWEYDFAGAPAHTQHIVRSIQKYLFLNTPGGLPGNDDGGALSSWYIFSALGLYPEIPGVAGFVVGSPLFTSAKLRLAGGHTLQINAPAAADDNPYVQSLTLNGQSSTKLWVPWENVKNGATLNFALGPNATNWGSNPDDVPPSFPPATNG